MYRSPEPKGSGLTSSLERYALGRAYLLHILLLYTRFSVTFSTHYVIRLIFTILREEAISGLDSLILNEGYV
jgi:hypothetical protein